MADQDMRLRLVVRRNGLPELRLMWHVQPNTNPTISKLLEQLNEQVPLESDHWGLEDYVVELHDNDGTDFECLHYQLVRSVLKPDDRVFIRALERDDHFRRRISGRDQISSDGRHLIDGIPFGQPRLRVATTRPNIYIPPLKRARLSYTQPNSDDFPGGAAADDEAPLLLTNGESHGELNDADSDADDDDFALDDAESSMSTDGSSSEDGDEDEDEEEDGSDDEDEDEDEDEVQDEVQPEAPHEDRDRASTQAIAEEVRELTKGRHASQKLSLSTLDKLTTLRVVFPTAPIDLCEQVLGASGEDLETTYKVLSEAFSPQMSQEAAIAWRPGGSLPHPRENLEKAPKQPHPSSGPQAGDGSLTGKRKFREESPVDDAEDDEYENYDNSLMRKYDHAGFPPGTITSGKGLAHMAAVSASFDNGVGSGVANGNSETTSTTLKALTDEPIGDDEEDDTSSSGDSSSNTSSDESDDSSKGASRSGHSSSESRAADPDAMDSDSSSDSSEESLSESDESDSDSGSGPEERSSKVTGRSSLTTKDDRSDDSNESLDTSSNDSSDSSDSSDETPDDESTDDDPSLESEEEDIDDSLPRLKNVPTKTEDPHTVSQPSRSFPKRTETGPPPVPVPPGAGKESTKRRNARRRAAKLAKRNIQAALGDGNTPAASQRTRDGGDTALNNEAAIFEAKRKALLDALASGGIEVGPAGETALGLETNHVKQKNTNDAGTDRQHDKNEDTVVVDEKSSNDHQAEPSQKRRRINLGAGRRLVFGALGVRNPKNKDEEERLRDRLRTDAQQEANRHVSSRSQPTADQALTIDDEEDPDAWKLKINYRAVECCQDNIELTPAPFPFRLRWDPHQQYPSGSKRNKRGGQSKRAQRNQDQYYESSDLDRKRKRYNSSEFIDGEYSGFYGRENTTTDGFDVTLNYDDAESEPRAHESDVVNATSQTTDLDDLPSLPKDASTLPNLRPGEAQVGMVITWLKWTCSSATGWQPQLSRVTAIVAKVDDDAATLKVCLARRDRYLDSNEKRYDHTTGQRIYDRFEAPDLQEEDEENDGNDEDGVDEGYRNISWADMKDPRILQQPLDPANELDSSAEHNQVEASAKGQAEPPQAPRAPSPQDTDVVANPTNPPNPDPMQVTDEVNLHVGDVPNSAGLLSEERQIEDSLEPSVEAASNSTSHHDCQSQQAADSMSDVSQISSPSRQLHETASQAMSSNSPPRNWIPASSVELGESPPANTSSSIPLPQPISSQSHQEEEDFESELIAETVRSAPYQETVPSSVGSIRSGHQPDYEMDIDNHVSDVFNATNDIDPQSDRHEQSTPLPARSSLTPIATQRTMTPTSTDAVVEDIAKKSPPSPSPSLGSLSSLSSLWCTAPTSRNTQGSSKAQDSPVVPKPSKSRIPRDPDYEDAMRRLDEQLDDVDSFSPPPASSSVEVKKENLSQFQKKTTLDEPISPPPRRRQPFTIPPGSQVVELSSDSEPAYSENYADDEIDETYTPKSDSLPKGEGWVKKRRDTDVVERRKTRKWAV